MKHLFYTLFRLLSGKGSWFIHLVYRLYLSCWVLTLLVGMLTTHLSWAQCPNPSSDYTALAEFYNATNGVNWVNHTNWLTNCEPCGWYGVSCDNNGRVVALNLSWNGLSSTIPTSLSALTELKTLDLSGNIFGVVGRGLSGSIPTSLGNLTKLQYINLSYNVLTGSIPVSLGNLTDLQYLNLAYNGLTGNIPASLSNLTQVNTLFLFNNQLDGCLPSSLSALCGKNVNFTNNPSLPGGGDFNAFCTNGTGNCSIPHPATNANQTAVIGIPFSYTVNAFTDVETPNNLTYSARISPANGLSFDATNRVISGTPTSTGVSSVTITATDPSGLSASTSFIISIVPCFNPSAEYMALVELYNTNDGTNWAYKNNWLSDCNLCSWYGVTCDGTGRVTQLDLSKNLLSGSIPNSLSALTNLQTLNLASPRVNILGHTYPALSGSLPASLGTLSNLQTLDLSNNSLSGSIPESFSALANLQSLNLSKNALSGSIPAGLGNLTKLQTIGLWSNSLGGGIPASLGNLINLENLFLENNKLSGSIPASLGNLINIKNLFLNSNELSGCIPTSLSALCGKNVDLSNGFVSNTGNFSAFCASGKGACSSAMPVNLVSFSAQVANNHAVKLTWTTASEENNDYFLLERSKDLLQIDPLAKIKAHEGGSFQSSTYSHTDEKPYIGTSYYRLRQVDLSGTSTTYPWESVIVRQQAYGVSPNPITNQQFSLQLDEPLTATIKFYTLEGRPVAFQKVGHTEGSLQLKTEQQLPVGVYILTVGERAQTRQYRLVVK